MADRCPKDQSLIINNQNWSKIQSIINSCFAGNHQNENQTQLNTGEQKFAFQQICKKTGNSSYSK